jgi:DNA-binding LacI/PurR family transcriptional regulator
MMLNVLSNRYAVGVPVTQSDVASRAGVSRALVSLVFRDATNVSDQSRARVLLAAEELGYRPNMLARSLASKKVRTIGVLLNDITNPFFVSMYVELSNAAQDAGYDVLVGPSLRSVAQERTLLSTLLGHRVAGLILISPLMKASELNSIISGYPAVSIARDMNLDGADFVSNDELVGARLGLRHLVDLGHERIVHISGGTSRSAVHRKRAFLRAMSELGLAGSARVIEGDFTEEAGRSAAREIIRSRASETAIFASNDLVAAGAMGVLEASGVRVPEDVSVLGYDNSVISDLQMVSLTSIEQPIRDFGRASIRLLLERIDGQRDTRVSLEFEPRLIVRRTTARRATR